MAKIIELIYSETKAGLGKENDPVRIILQLWTKSGELVAQTDLDDEYLDLSKINL